MREPGDEVIFEFIKFATGGCCSATSGGGSGQPWDQAKQLPGPLRRQFALLFLHSGAHCSHIQPTGTIIQHMVSMHGEQPGYKGLQVSLSVLASCVGLLTQWAEIHNYVNVCNLECFPTNCMQIHAGLPVYRYKT